MEKKLKIRAPTLSALRSFLTGAEVDFGCRPVALKEAGGFYTIAKADDAQIGRLNARGSAARSGVVIEILEELPDPKTKLQLVQRINRFASGGLPHGLGRKE